MTYAYDINTSTFTKQARRLLDEVDTAGRALAGSRVVPGEVVALVRSFDDRLHARVPLSGLAGVDPLHAERLLGGAVVCLTALTAERSPERRRGLRLGLEQVRQALQDIVEGAPAHADRPAGEVARWLVGTLDVPQTDAAWLLGVSPRTLQRWLAAGGSGPSGADAARLRVVASTVAHLRHALSGPGVLQWFRRSRADLDGGTPADLLADPAGYARLRTLAAAARSAGAA